MKKIYNSPILKVVEIKTQAVLTIVSNYETGDAPVQTGGKLGTRRARFSDWDFEEEE